MSGARPPPLPPSSPGTAGPPPPSETLPERLAREAEATTDATRRAVLLTSLAELSLGGDRDEARAIDHCERAHEADPSYLPALDLLYASYRRLDEPESLARVARARAAAMGPGPERAEALVDLAEVLEDRVGDAAAADEAIDEALHEDPACRSAWMVLERRSAAMGDAARLRAALEGLARVTTDPMRRGLLLVDAAQLALEAGDTEASVALAREAASLPAGRWRFLRSLERIAEQSGRDDLLAEALLARAAVAMRVAPESDPDASAVAHIGSAESAAALAVWLYRRAARHLLERLGDAARADDALSAAARMAPDDPLVANDRLRVLEVQGRLDEVRAALEGDLAAAVPGPAAAALRCRLADLAIRGGDAEGARTHLEAARVADPGSVAVRALLEELLTRSGDFGALADLYAADAESQEDAARAFSATVAADLWERGAKDPERALGAWSVAAAAEPEEVGARLARIDLLRRLDRPADLAADLEALAERMTVLDIVVALLREVAILRASANDPEAERAAIDRAVSLQPDAPAPRLGQALMRVAAGDARGASEALRVCADLVEAVDLRGALLASSAVFAPAEASALAEEAATAAAQDAFARVLQVEIERSRAEGVGAVDALVRMADADPGNEQAWLAEAAFLAARLGRPADEVTGLLERAAGAGTATWCIDARLADARARRDDQAVADALDDRAASGDGLDALEAAEWHELRLGKREDAARMLEATGVPAADDPSFPARWTTSTDAKDLAALAASAAASAPPALAATFSATALSIAGLGGADPETLGALARSALEGDGRDAATLLWSAWLATARGDANARWEVLATLPPSADTLAAALLASLVAGAGPWQTVDAARRLHEVAESHPALPAVLLRALAPGQDPAARLVALRLARDLARPPDAADLDVEIGQILDRVGEQREAEAAFRRALDACGDDLAAIEGVRRTIRTTGEPAERVELGERAAKLVGDVPEAAPIWEDTGILLEDSLGSHVRAERAYAKALALDIMRSEAYRRIHVMLEDRGGFDELGDLLARRSAVVDDPEKLLPLLLEQAAVAAEREDTDGALRVLEEALMLDSKSLEARAQKARLLAEAGEHEGAVEAYLAEAEVAGAEGKRRARGDAAKLLAGPLGDPKRAVAILLALEEENALEVEDLEAASAIAASAELEEDLVDVLHKIAEKHPDASGRAGAHRRIASIAEDGGRMDEAAAELRALLEIVPDDEAALSRHAELVVDPVLRRAPLDAAEDKVRKRLANAPVDREALSLLARIHAWSGDRDGRWLVLALRDALGAATPDEREELVTLAAAPPSLPAVSVPTERVDEVIGHPDDAGPLRAMLDAFAPHLGKFDDLSPKRLGLGRSERIRDKDASPLRDRIRVWADVFGIGELELYQGGSDKLRILPLPGEPPILVVGPGIDADMDAPRRFALGSALCRIRRGRAGLHGREEREVFALLCAAAAIGGATNLPPAPKLEETRKRLADALPRKIRNGLADLVSGFVAAADPGVVVRAERASANRAGLLCAGDVRSALAVVSPKANDYDLVRFAVSRELAALRREMGLAIR